MPRSLTWLAAAVLVCTFASQAFAIAGTSQVAQPGQKVTPQDSWPKGVAELLNLPARQSGWNDWFSEWPNDVCHYEFAAKNTAELNAILEQFAQIDADLHVHLALGKEPRGFGWVSQIKEGNNTPLVYSQGNQERINQWYKQLGGRKFGVMEFMACPVAVPPTITLFVQNDAVELDKLVIPAAVKHVTQGYLPGAFHISNLLPQEKPAPPAKPARPADLPPETRAALERIEAFLAKRKEKL